MESRDERRIPRAEGAAGEAAGVPVKVRQLRERPVRRPVPHETRTAVLQRLFAGAKAAQVAREFGLTLIQVGRIKAWERHRREGMAMAQTARGEWAKRDEWYEEIRGHARQAVVAGVTCEEDQYRRGELGVKVLKGIGDFAPDTATTLEAVIATRPADWPREGGKG